MPPRLMLRSAGRKMKAWARRSGAAAAVLVGVLLAMAGLRAMAIRLTPPDPDAMTEAEARRVLPGELRLERQGREAFAAWRRGPSGEEPAGFAARGEGHGHAPGLVAVVGLSPEGRILRVEILRHGETPSFMDACRRGGLLTALAGRSPDDRLEIGLDVDAVSGATHTSRGVTEAVRRALRSLEGSGGLRHPVAGPTLPDWKSLAAALYLLLVAALLPRLHGRTRLAIMGLSVVLLGGVLGRLFSVSDVARAASGMLPAGVEGTGLVVFFAALAVATLWRGRMWCSHCCPFGVLSELGGRLTGARARAKLPAALGKAARFLPWVVFGAVAGTVAWTGRMSAAAAEPFGFAAQLLGRPLSTGTLVAAAPLAAAVFGAALLLSLISLRFYCRFLCGAGALLGLCCRLRASRQAEPGFNRE